MANHWTADGDLVVETKTLFRQVGWIGHRAGDFYKLGELSLNPTTLEPGGFSPVYQQIATWVEGEGWDD